MALLPVPASWARASYADRTAETQHRTLVAHYQVMLNGHQALRVDCQIPVRSQGQTSQETLQIELPITRASAVAVSKQVVETVAIQLTADQGFDHSAWGGPLLK